MAVGAGDQGVIDDVEAARPEDERDRRGVHRREEGRDREADHDAAGGHRGRRCIPVGIAPDERVPSGMKKCRGEKRREDEKAS